MKNLDALYLKKFLKPIVDLSDVRHFHSWFRFQENSNFYRDGLDSRWYYILEVEEFESGNPVAHLYDYSSQDEMFLECNKRREGNPLVYPFVVPRNPLGSELHVQ